MTKVFIADDHVLIREGLKKILREEPDFALVGEAQTAAETLSLIGKTDCQILVLDLALPDRPGLEVLTEVRKKYPLMRVLILSMFPESSFALRTLKAGADGYLTKDSAANELVTALRTIAVGGRYVSGRVSQMLVDAMQGEKGVSHFESLSDRELQILQMIGKGKTVTQIAGELNLSVSTVNTHRIHILEKLGLGTTADLIRYAIENKLVE